MELAENVPLGASLTVRHFPKVTPKVQDSPTVDSVDSTATWLIINHPDRSLIGHASLCIGELS